DVKVTRQGVSNSNGITTVAFLGNETLAPVGGVASGVYQAPRIGFDYFIINGLSLGGSFTIVSISTDAGSGTDILFAPRVGYAYMFSDMFGIWPRGGFSYWHQSVDPDGPGDQSAHAFAFN